MLAAFYRNLYMGKLFFVLAFFGYQLTAQTAISGKIDFENTLAEPKVYLAKLSVEHIEDLKYEKSIAWSKIKEDGTYSFDKKHIAHKDAVYRIYVNRFESAIKDTIAEGTTFILSSSDQIDFLKNDNPFINYTNSNHADKEWKKFQAFETELLQSQLSKEESSEQFKSYAKDSLRILMVKLIGVKQLEKRQLLDQDIAKNPDFYLTLLAELKESEMPHDNYLFLEKRLAFLTQEVVAEKYAWSKILNLVLGILIIGLGGVFYFQRKKKLGFTPLSRQEQNIQNLIIEGKSNKEIASELFISLSTVKSHITNIYNKLQVSGRQELVQKNKIRRGAST